MSATALLVCFVCLKERTFEIRENVFYFTSKALFVLEINQILTFSDIQMSWRHQMHKHETRNVFSWINWEINTAWWWNLTSLCKITKENFIKNFYEKWDLETSSKLFLLFKESSVKRNLRRSVYSFGQVLIVLLVHI